MANRPRGERWVRWSGIGAGVALAVVSILAWRVSPGTGTPGLDLTVAVQPTGELQTLPAGPAFFATGMAPTAGSELRGSFTVRNRTGVALAVHVRALPSSGSIDGTLMVRIDDGGQTLFSGPLGALRSWTQASFTLASGKAAALEVSAWLAPAAAGYIVDETVSVEFLAQPAGG
ncbi:MAG: hypothetical protein E6G47_01580 [Actinobacteria bacterium]|nr:MAG: hypothetical protein E6G47_01580 [Actinomycetota bacterium]